MTRTILITKPRYDNATEYLSHFAGLVTKKLENKNIRIKELSDKSVDRTNFTSFISKLDPELIFINGHGNPNCLFGNKDKILVQEGVNEKLLKDRIIYARACNAGLSLGKVCVKDSKNGCFIGYKSPFSFYIDEKWSANPKKDTTVKLFLEPSNNIVISLAKGNTTKNTHINSKKMIAKNIKKLLMKKQEPETFCFIECLWNNFTGQVLHGNPEAMF